MLAAGAGLALPAAHAPVGWSHAILLVPALLLAAVHVDARQPRPRPARHGAVAAVVGHALLLFWLVDAAGYVAWAGLTLVQAAWWALLATLFARVRTWVVGPLVLALAWVGIDAWRATWPLGGFAWGTLAAAEGGNAWLNPLARVGGEHLMTLAIALLAVAGTRAVLDVLDATGDDDGPSTARRLRAALPAGRTATAWVAGTALVVTLATVEPPAPSGTVDVAMVQPWDEEFWRGSTLGLDEVVADNATRLTRTVVAEGVPDLTVWPESSIDQDPARSPALADALATGGRLTDGRLLAGVNLDGDPPSETFRNTAVVVGDDGTIVDLYQKRHLVPFGEYVPYRPLLDWYPALRQTPRDGLSGGGAHRVEVGGLDVAVAICFETLFGSLVRGNVLAGGEPAGLVVASTNDVSFGRVGQPAQHRDQSRLRALETGRYVVHASVAGGSALITPDGEIRDVTPLFVATSRRWQVPVVTGRTPYLVTGDWVGSIAMLVVVGLALLVIRDRWRRRRDGAATAPEPAT